MPPRMLGSAGSAGLHQKVSVEPRMYRGVRGWILATGCKFEHFIRNAAVNILTENIKVTIVCYQEW